MNLNLRVLTPNRVVWDSEVQEIILTTNSGQIGVLPNHTAIVTALDIGVMKIRLNAQWSTMALMGGFAKIDNNEITLLVNNAERGIDIDPREAQETFRLAKVDLGRAEGKKQAIEADVALKRARTRLEAVDAILPK
jgi:F-type H+-transporting ATPase subunit epsilon|uniref:ATP synthase epsilon chain, chloroplastic n=18 Tax=Taxus TaxID=25628 RepID=A0A1C9M352_TAXCH|nr:ATP synthase CF1 epsilon subunit [Taxus mairei]YP_009500239.1 ATP synthase CF1 epsilon subunit [Taxus fuana]YP_009576008.1 ATP synthase CF1 epsilon subunit [Taxus wallichiana]YP_009578178.1 ATP synthase CF1 epsilon subunit [Taxus phytonii]YP_009578260.1 ATP synthase CF1 epsilon subunit [Taxus chinensis]YP_009578342.1 ATP synthase CF1 epsilon subunit [Taxus contorta]YP_009578424.1 ATP synthase CF1 epsilon subunit [Taxus cuspidata]YP_009578506.1 ATP synthase CF1 epsilon subunit [Taxus canad